MDCLSVAKGSQNYALRSSTWGGGEPTARSIISVSALQPLAETGASWCPWNSLTPLFLSSGEVKARHEDIESHPAKFSKGSQSTAINNIRCHRLKLSEIYIGSIHTGGILQCLRPNP